MSRGNPRGTPTPPPSSGRCRRGRTGRELPSPSLAASGPFFSLNNTDFVVTVAFVLFVAVLLYLKVPSIVTKMLDDRSKGIQSELDEARSLREEAQSLLASYERKQQEISEQSERIISNAKDEAAAAAEQAKKDLSVSIERRIAASNDQISSAQSAAIREIRNKAITIAISALEEVISSNLDSKQRSELIDSAVKEVEEKLH